MEHTKARGAEKGAVAPHVLIALSRKLCHVAKGKMRREGCCLGKSDVCGNAIVLLDGAKPRNMEM